MASGLAALGATGPLAPLAASAVAGGGLYLLIDAALHRRSPLKLTVVEEHVVGLPGEPVPAGRGVLVVRAHHAERNRRVRRWWSLVWQDEATDEERPLFDYCRDPDAVRESAVGLAELAGWGLRWLGDGERRPETQPPAQLKTSFRERASKLPALLPRAAPMPGRLDIVEEGDGLSVTFPAPVGLRRQSVAPALAAGAPGVVGLATGMHAIGGVFGLLGVTLAGAAVLARRAWVERLVIDAREVTLHWRGLPAGRATPWASPVDDVEALHLESTPTPRLVLVVGGRHVAMGEGTDLGELRWARAAIAAALVGADVAEVADEHADRDAPLPRSPLPAGAPEARCPTDDGGRMERVGGPLDELACSRCGGRFSSGEGAERLVEELGLDVAMLRDLAQMYAGARAPCPGCRTPMSTIQLKGVGLKLCTGCGGMWFARGDLGRLSQGRYTG